MDKLVLMNIYLPNSKVPTLIFGYRTEAVETMGVLYGDTSLPSIRVLKDYDYPDFLYVRAKRKGQTNICRINKGTWSVRKM